jgi:multidrug efflux pump
MCGFGKAVLRPAATPLLAIALLGGFNLYGQFGKGLLSSLRSSLISCRSSARARQFLDLNAMHGARGRTDCCGEIASIYARSMMSAGRGDEETIGTLQLELTPDAAHSRRDRR